MSKKNDSKARKEKKQKDPNAPKRAKTAYFLFMDDKRAEVKRNHPDMKVTEIGAELGRLWKLLKPAEQEQYKAKAEQAKAKYVKELAAYNAKK